LKAQLVTRTSVEEKSNSYFQDGQARKWLKEEKTYIRERILYLPSKVKETRCKIIGKENGLVSEEICRKAANLLL